MNEPSSPAKSREEFAARLRELRAQAGSPSFRKLAKITNYSSSTLADATLGRRLPTEPVLKALVAACGADPEPWLAELRQIPATGQPTEGADSSGRGTGAPATMRDRRLGRWHVPVLAAGTVAVFATGLGIGLVLAPVGGAGSQGTGQQLPGVPAFFGSPTPAPTAGVADGTDPNIGHCKPDARLIDRAAVIMGGVQIGALDLMYSARCGAGWARLYLYPGHPVMMGVVTVRSGDVRFNTIADPLVKQVDDYTDVVVPGPGGCLGASGVVYQAGQPVVTASIPCERGW